MNHHTCRAKITALGTYIPPDILSNAQLEKMIDTTEEWIIERTGIRTRHIVSPGTATSDLTVAAIQNLLRAHPISLAEIDLLIIATVTPDMFFPSTACLVQKKLNMANIWGFDLSAACSGFIYALTTGASFITSGMYQKVLVVGADTNSSMVNYQDRTTAVLFGDGAGVVLLEKSTSEENLGVIDCINEINGLGGQYLYRPGGGSLHPGGQKETTPDMHFIHQEGQHVFKFAVRKIIDSCQAILKKHQLSFDDIDCFIPHQANLRIIQDAAKALELPAHKVIININDYGNTTAATIPLAIETARQAGKLKKGDLVLLASVGAGFTSGVSLLRWAY